MEVEGLDDGHAARLPLAESSSAGRLDPEHVARGEVERRLRRELLIVEQIASRRTPAATVGACRTARAAFADERRTAALEYLDLPDDAVAAAVSPLAAGAEPKLVPSHP
jgi:hypothetical protein